VAVESEEERRLRRVCVLYFQPRIVPVFTVRHVGIGNGPNPGQPIHPSRKLSVYHHITTEWGTVAHPH
jgi:hypothetical protein